MCGLPHASRPQYGSAGASDHFRTDRLIPGAKTSGDYSRPRWLLLLLLLLLVVVCCWPASDESILVLAGRLWCPSATSSRSCVVYVCNSRYHVCRRGYPRQADIRASTIPTFGYVMCGSPDCGSVRPTLGPPSINDRVLQKTIRDRDQEFWCAGRTLKKQKKQICSIFSPNHMRCFWLFNSWSGGQIWE